MEQAWRLDLAWRGEGFVGWQRQPEGRSVQGVLEEVLGGLYGLPRLEVRASGRTDAGVHALHQVAAAVAPREREPAALLRGLWGRLPPDLSCLEARPAPLDFDPRRWALGKLYRYRILRRRAPCPFRQGHCWRHALPLDLAAMREAAALLVGRHDFAAFRAAGCSARSTIRPLTHLRLIEQEEELWIEVEGNGFLRHQVRIIAGSLVEVGEGRRSPDSLRRALQEGRRELAGRTAPAEGLWLVRVDMGEGPRTGDTTEEEG